MPSWTSYLLFISFALAASFTPGPAVMLSIHNALHLGWHHAIWSSLGNITGLLVLSTLSALGLNAVLQSSAAAFTLLKFVGAAYLIWLGVQQWRRAGARPSAELAQPRRGQPPLAAAPHAQYPRGLMVALTNPKAILFIAALFPQFISLTKPMLPQYATLTLSFMLVSLLALSTYASLAVLARRRLKAWFASGWPQRASGVVFCAFGLALLRLRRP
jgi:threonine/homoserine/homoserine lactone efflux protein